jgi:prepilin-type processing-associated H-X9-DG protein/prepilin-type N-terminal cleavage/methylation domain-containing protein
MKPFKRVGFTLVELLVVIGIIALLISILLPALSRARNSAKTLACLSNLRTLGQAAAMYAGEHKQYLPYPTTTLGEEYLWFNVLDPYLQANEDHKGRTGVASERNYKRYKQCEVYESFEGGQYTGAQDALKEFARTYKMNSMLRHNNPASPARVIEIRQSSEVVFIGDGVSLDLTGPVADLWESGQFSMEVNDVTEANPALRHNGGANILFIDGHASNIVLKPITKNLRSPVASFKVKSWESEFVNAAGTPVDVPDYHKSAASQGLTRNPNMPLIWSDPGHLYRP